MGTRFLATPEANAHARYKERLVMASEEETVRTILFGNGWPDALHRVLRTDFVKTWLPREAETQSLDANEPPIGETVVAGLVCRCLVSPLFRRMLRQEVMWNQWSFSLGRAWDW
jgi:NAD(P)H-dependent flavin oxidoreductase YrpB (nitropropane dioxygenase family)